MKSATKSTYTFNGFTFESRQPAKPARRTPLRFTPRIEAQADGTFKVFGRLQPVTVTTRAQAEKTLASITGFLASPLVR